MSTTLGYALAETLLGRREKERYSVASFLRSINPSTPQRERGCLESELSDAIAQRIGRPGNWIPPQIFLGSEEEQAAIRNRTLQAGNGPDGGFTTGTTTGPLLQYLHPRSAALRSGATLLPVDLAGEAGGGFSYSLQVPVESASDEAEWCSELGTAIGGSSEFGMAVGKARRLYAERRISRQLLATSAMSRTIDRILMSSLAAAIDRGALAGSGGVQPLGLSNNDQVTSISHGTDGGAPSLTTFDQHVREVIESNAPMVSPGWILSPKSRSKTVRTPWFTDGSIPLTSTVNGLDQTLGFPSTATAYLPDNLTKGAGVTLGSALFGDWSTLIVALWPFLSISADPYTDARTGLTTYYVEGYADVLTPRPECFRRSVDLITT